MNQFSTRIQWTLKLSRQASAHFPTDIYCSGRLLQTIPARCLHLGGGSWNVALEPILCAMLLLTALLQEGLFSSKALFIFVAYSHSVGDSLMLNFQKSMLLEWAWASEIRSSSIACTLDYFSKLNFRGSFNTFQQSLIFYVTRFSLCILFLECWW